MLANDSNPFPAGDRTLTDVSVTSGKGEISIDGDQVRITPAEDFHGILSAQYRVLDDTEDPDARFEVEIFVDQVSVHQTTVGFRETDEVSLDVDGAIRLQIMVTPVTDDGTQGDVVLGDPVLSGRQGEVPDLTAEE